MNYKVAICDDENSIINTINEYLSLYSFQYDIDFSISTFDNPVNLLNAYSSPGAFHIVFLDVEMPEISGITLAEHIRTLPDYNVFIIFVSSYPEYMKDSFNVQAFQYLTKPISKEIFFQEINRIIDYINKSNRTQIMINTGTTESEVIFTDNIIYIENVNSKKKLVRIFTADNRIIDTFGTIGEFEDKLTNNNTFHSPSRGFIINLKHVHYISANSLVMDNSSEIPLSRRKEKAIRGFFNDQLLNISSHR